VDLRRAAVGAARAVALALPLAFLALFFAYPLATILERGLTADGGLELPLDVLGSRDTLGILWFTAWQAAVSTALTLALGLPLAWAIARYDFPGRSLARALVLVPFVLPTVVVAAALLSLPGLERGLFAILAAHVFFNLAVVVRVVSAWWGRLDPALWETAATLGAGPSARFRAVTLPLLAPALASSGALVFLFCFTSFGVILILGGPAYSTLETEIYYQAVRLFDLRAAALLALLQLVGVALAVLVATRLETRLAVRGQLRPEEDVLRAPRTTRERAIVAGSLGGLGLFLGLPLLVLVERSLAVGDGYGLDAYRALGEPTSALLATPWEAVANSILYAAGATLVAVLVGGLAAFAITGSERDGRRARALDVLLTLPLGASSVMLGFGFVIAFDTAPLDFRSEPWIVPVAQALVAIPFVVRIVAPTLRAVDPSQREAAAVLGAAPGRVRRAIDLPVAARALSVAAGFAFAISLGEFGATVFLARPESPTLPVAIFRFLSRPGELNAGQAYALAVVLMVVVTLSVLLVERIRASRTGWL
jgi:thiamine transport system permease protein